MAMHVSWAHCFLMLVIFGQEFLSVDYNVVGFLCWVGDDEVWQKSVGLGRDTGAGGERRRGWAAVMVHGRARAVAKMQAGHRMSIALVSLCRSVQWKDGRLVGC
jgi:hypothetical protein